MTWSKKQLEQSGRYSQDEIDALIARCTKEKKYMDDPNFPGVEHLRRYHIIDDVSATNQNQQEDQQRINSSGALSNAEATYLTGEGQEKKNMVTSSQM